MNSKTTCQICQEEGHGEDACPNFRVERNMSDIRREMAALDDTLKNMTEYAGQLGEDTNEAIAKFKEKVDKLFRPLIKEVYATIGRELTRKEQHVAESPRTSRTGSGLIRDARETEPERNGSVNGINDPDDDKHSDGIKCSTSGMDVCQRHPITRRLLVNLTANGQVFVKHEPICGADPRKVMSKEDWEEMVDFLVFWDALDVGDEKKLEGEVKELNEKFPMGETLSEGTEERDKKFLQLEKTKKSSKSRKTTKSYNKSKAQEERADKQEEERWALELQRREQVERTRQELAEKLEKMHEEGYGEGLAKGENVCPTHGKLEPKDKDGLLEGLYEDIELATDQQLNDILENAKDFLKEATKDYIKCAKYRASLQDITGQQIKAYGFEDGYIRGRIVSKDKRRGLSKDLDTMMDEVYRTISIMRRTGAAKREVRDLMTTVKKYLDKMVIKHIALEKAVDNPTSHTCRHAIRSGSRATETEGSEDEEKKEQDLIFKVIKRQEDKMMDAHNLSNSKQDRTQSTTEPSAEPMDETAAEGDKC